MDTPLYAHITNYPSVYEPAEDSFLFIDALEQELPFIKSLNPKLICEIGSGSGINITAVAKSLGTSVHCLATDINNDACLATKETAKINNVSIDVCNMSFLDAFRKNIFDLIIFNPPYVVTDSNEIFGRGIERSWAGGKRGREVMDKLFPKLPELLTDNGVFYIVVIKENDPIDVINTMQQFNFKSEIVKDRKILGEHLYVLKFQKYKNI